MKKAVFAVLLIILAVLVFVSFRKKTVTFEKTNKQNNQPAAFEAINGIWTSEAMAKIRPIAVMVENYPDARPQSGLSDADLVYETLAEGGITRFLSVYQTVNSENIGPVRSARTYFADLADELGAIFVHVGGNSDALADIKSKMYRRISDADQFFNDAYFQRIGQRPAPHNVYTSADKINSLAKNLNYSVLADYQPWQFKNDQPVATATAGGININFSLSEYAVRWQYNRENNNYLRFIAGAADKDANNLRQISAKNIAVQFVKTWPVQSDTAGSISMDLNGNGQAIVFYDGTAIAGQWQKQNGRTRYYDKNGMEIKFNRGKIWVELVPVESQPLVTWSAN